MKIFVSYSFRDQNDWVKGYVIPLIECFGHEVVTGETLGGAPLPLEVKKLIQRCRHVMCFTTRDQPRYTAGGEISSYEPPAWVVDEMMMARGMGREVVEFREDLVTYGGAAQFAPYSVFTMENMPALLLKAAKILKEWPVGPLQLRLNVPADLIVDFEQRVIAGTVRAICTAIDQHGDQMMQEEELNIRFVNGQFIVPLWIKPDPNMAINLEILYQNQKLVCHGISPALCNASLKSLGAGPW